MPHGAAVGVERELRLGVQDALGAVGHQDAVVDVHRRAARAAAQPRPPRSAARSSGCTRERNSRKAAAVVPCQSDDRQQLFGSVRARRDGRSRRQLPMRASRWALASRSRLRRSSARSGAGAQQVADAVGEDQPVDRLGDEVGGADLVGAADRVDVVEAGHHHDRHVGAARQRADLLAHREAVDARHLHVEQHQVGRLRAAARRSPRPPSDASSTSMPSGSSVSPTSTRIVGSSSTTSTQRALARRGVAHDATPARPCERRERRAHALELAASARRRAGGAARAKPSRPCCSMSRASAEQPRAPTCAALDFSECATTRSASASAPPRRLRAAARAAPARWRGRSTTTRATIASPRAGLSARRIARAGRPARRTAAAQRRGRALGARRVSQRQPATQREQQLRGRRACGR